MDINKKALILDLGILVLGLISFLILDMSLTLGKFHWLVFYLYSLYFSAAYFAVNVILYFVFRKKNRALANSFLVCAIASVGIALLLWLSSSLLQ